MLVRHRHFITGVTRQTVVAAGFVIHRTNYRRLVHPLGRQRQVFADADSGSGRVDRFELTANFRRSVRLHVPHVLRGSSSEQVEMDDTLGFPWSLADRLTGLGV